LNRFGGKRFERFQMSNPPLLDVSSIHISCNYKNNCLTLTVFIGECVYIPDVSDACGPHQFRTFSIIAHRASPSTPIQRLWPMIETLIAALYKHKLRKSTRREQPKRCGDQCFSIYEGSFPHLYSGNNLSNKRNGQATPISPMNAISPNIIEQRYGHPSQRISIHPMV